MTIRTIGVLTAGGDCPGLNAVVRAVTKTALGRGLRVVGIADGFLGLIENRVRELSSRDVAGILALGGTILGSSNKANPSRFATGVHPDGSPRIEDVSPKVFRHIREHAIDALVVIGGDGSMSCAHELLSRARDAGVALRVVGLPKTIDNDIAGTEVTFGFATAVHTATDAIDKVRTTAASHHRVMCVEVMGRNAGWIALHAGVASGAHVILVPEIPFSFDAVASSVKARAAYGSRYSIICVAEGARPQGGQPLVARVDPTSPDPIRLGGVGKFVADELERRTGIEARYVVLGHVQRGGPPVPADRILGTILGRHALEILARDGATERMAAIQNGRLTDVAIADVAGKQRLVGPDEPLLAAARAVHTSFGEA